MTRSSWFFAAALLAAPALAQWQPPDPAALSPSVTPRGNVIPRAGTDDPPGDVFGIGPDILHFEAWTESGVLYILYEFRERATPCDSGQTIEVCGYIDLDLDQRRTSNPAHAQTRGWCPEIPALGADAVIVMFDQTVRVHLPDRKFLAEASYEGRILRITVPLADLGDDGSMDVATVVGWADGPSDCAPNDSFLSTGPVSGNDVPGVGVVGLTVLAILLAGAGAAALGRS